MKNEIIIKKLEEAIDRIQARIDQLKSDKPIDSKKQIIDTSCIHASRTGQQVRCKTCGGAEYIFCSIKAHKVNERLCNLNCKDYSPK